VGTLIQPMRLLGFQIANGYSSEARVFASLLVARPTNARTDGILVVHHSWPGDRKSADRFETDSHVDVARRDIGWRPAYPKRSLQARVQGRLRFLAVQPQLQRLAMKFRPDVVVSAQQQWDSGAAHAVACRMGVPYVMHLHYNVGAWLGRSTLQRLRTSAHIITVSDFIRGQVISLGVPEVRVTTVRNTMQLPPESDTAARAFRQELALPDDAVLVTFVSRLDPFKGHHETIQAFDRLAESHPTAYLVIVGDGTIRTELEAKANATRAALRIRFMGHRSDVRSILAASDIFVHPSYSDPFPLAVLEACAAGLPVVAFAEGGIPEVISNGETGLLVETGNVKALSESIGSLVADRELAKRMGFAGRARIAAEFRPEDASARYFDLLHNVSGGNATATRTALGAYHP